MLTQPEVILIGVATIGPVTAVTLVIYVVLFRTKVGWRKDESSYNHLARRASNWFTTVGVIYLAVVGAILLVLRELVQHKP